MGCAQFVFVTDGLVQHLRSGAPPYANACASHPLPDGTWPLLSLEEVRAANSGKGVNALTTWWNWAEAETDAGQRLEIRTYMARTFPLYYQGYHFEEVLIQANGDWALQALLYAGYDLITDYAEHYRTHPPAPAADAHPYLLGLTRPEALKREGSLVSQVFVYAPPQFHFKPREQELLQLALEGLSDEEIVQAESIGIGRDGVKTRWRAIYARVAAVAPTLLPAGREGVRGAEKRRLLLGYLRDHMEELRPLQARQSVNGSRKNGSP